MGTARAAAPGAFVEIDGRRLHYTCIGHGSPTVVFESGIAASSLSWTLVQPEVAALTRACAYDRAGLAWSDAGDARRSMRTFVEELRGWLDGAHIAPPYVLVAHSFGGLIIRAFAHTFPADTAGLVFVDTLHPAEWANPTREQQHLLRGAVFLSRVGASLAAAGIVGFFLSRLAGGSPEMPRRVSRMFGSQAAELIERMVGEVQKLPIEVRPAIQSHWSHPRAFRAMAQHLAALPACSEHLAGRREEFGDLPLVTLSASNRQPRWLAADAELARASSRGRHLVSASGGHWIHLDDPALVVQAISDVVAEVRSKSRF